VVTFPLSPHRSGETSRNRARRTKFRTTPHVAFIALLMVITISSSAHALEVVRENLPLNNFFGVGARSMGMGGAFLACGDDFSSLYWNPAGLGLIRRIELSGSLSHESRVTETSFLGSRARSPDHRTRFNSGGVVLPIPVYRGSLVLAAGVNRVQSFDLKYHHQGLDTLPDSGETVRFEDEKELRRGGLYQWSAGFSVEAARNLFLGLSLNAWTGDYDYELAMEAKDTEQVNQVIDRSLDIWQGNARFKGFNITLGTVYLLTGWLRTGLTLSTPTTFRLSGDDRLATEIVYDSGAVSRDTSVYGFQDEKLPYTVSVGIALTPPYFRLESDIRYSGWDELENKEAFFSGDGTGYRSTTEIHVGGEFYLPYLPLCVRLGYYTNPVALKGVTVSRKREYYTAGLGIIIQSTMTINIAWTRGEWEITQPGYRTRSKVDRIFTTVAYRF